MSNITDETRTRREQWRWRGRERPSFAKVPMEGEESVWDYPRPPAIVPDEREIVIRWGTLEVARTRHAIRVLETAHPPSFYLPWEDVVRDYVVAGFGSSSCEWKGPARYWSLAHGDRRLDNVGWSYPNPLPGAEALNRSVAFYPTVLECFVAGARVIAQPGGFYGGWITPELTGPFKGSPGSSGW